MGDVARHRVRSVNRPILIIWHDAHAGTDTWVNLDNYKDPDPYVVNSIGWLLDENLGGKPNHITIAQSWSDDDAVDSILHIPIAMVQQVITLKGKRSRDKGRTSKDS
jgi:hypothetical protein